MAHPAYIVLSIISLLNVGCSGSADASCALLKFTAMKAAHRICAVGVPVPSMEALHTSGRTNMTGAEFVDIFREYCRAVPQIRSCVQAKFTERGCSSEDFAAFVARANVSDAVCDGNGDVSPAVAAIFKDTPAVGLYFSDDPCMTIAKLAAGTCFLPQMAGIEKDMNVGYEEARRRILERALPCVMDRVASDMNHCPRAHALLTTALYAAEIPPHLGVDMAVILQAMASGALATA